MRFFQYIGERSYSLYLLHPILVYGYMVNGAYEGIYRVAAPYVGPYAYVFCVLATAPVLFLAVEATYRCVEVPGILLGSRLIGRLRGSESQRVSSGEVTKLGSGLMNEVGL
jgi:peptidoglycan/LPS O-acetylase OafA/YrhL